MSFWQILSFLRAAALCLAQALLKCQVPKSLTPSSGWNCVGLTEGNPSPNLKETLINRLLMTDQSDEMEDSSRPHPIICTFVLCFFYVLPVYLYVWNDFWIKTCLSAMLKVYSNLVCRDFPNNLIANILVSLTMKDTRTGLRFLMGTNQDER